MLQIVENVSFSLLVSEYEDAISAMDAAIASDDEELIRQLDRKVSMAFDAIIACRPRNRAEETRLFHYLLGKLCQFEAGGALSAAIEGRVRALFDGR